MENLLNSIPTFWVVIVTIIITLIGNAIWEFMVKPSFGKVRNLILSIITFGTKKAETSIYKRVSSSLHCSPFPAHNGHLLLLLATCLIVTGFIYIKSVTYDAAINLEVKINDKISSLQEQNIAHEKHWQDLPKIEKLQQLALETDELIEHATTKIIYVIIFFSAVLIYLSVEYCIVIYTDIASTHIRQILSKIRPYISETEALALHALASSIENRKDFFCFIESVYEKFEQNNVKFTKFDPW